MTRIAPERWSWIGSVAVGIITTVAWMPSCAWSGKVLAAVFRPGAAAAWALTLLLCFGVSWLLATGVARHPVARGRRRIVTTILSAGCAAAALGPPVLLLGYAITDNAPACQVGPIPLLFAAYLAGGFLLAGGTLVWLTVRLLVRSARGSL